MVLLTARLCCQAVGSVRARGKGQPFVDSLRVYCRGGPGGTGLPSLGGVGGRGGAVWVVGSSKKDLKTVQKERAKQRYLAEGGGNSSKLRIVGEPGRDLEVSSPVGVSVVTDEGRVLGEILSKEDRVLVAAGGQGGNKSTDFHGLWGQARSVKLDLKLLADVGFVGFPNAGKSTLLAAMSRAKPKIASYPFTTIRPNLGVAEFPDLRRITLADLPGLIEGASYNVGMGHKFLKHVERTRLLLFVVDVNGFQFKPGSPRRSALDTILLLNKELELYKSDLLDKPAVLALTKMDLPGAGQREEELRRQWERVCEEGPATSGLPEELLPGRMCRFDEIVSISAKYSPDTAALLSGRVRHWMDEQAAARAEAAAAVLEERLEEAAVPGPAIY